MQTASDTLKIFRFGRCFFSAVLWSALMPPKFAQYVINNNIIGSGLRGRVRLGRHNLRHNPGSLA